MPAAQTPPTSTGKRDRLLPPGPKGYALLNLSEFEHRPIEYLGGLWREYGDLVRLPIMPGLTFFLAAHPDSAEHILSSHQSRYGKQDLFLKSMGLMQGQGLLTSEGAVWLRQRRLMQPVFRQQQLVALHEVMRGSVESMLDEWARKPDGEVIDIAVEMTKLTLKIVSLALFSVDISDESNQVGRASRSALEYVYARMMNPLSLPPWLPTPANLKFRQAKQVLDNTVIDIIQSRRQNPTAQEDLLSMLLACRDEDTGEGMSDRELQDEIITLINAGHETTATALAWTWHLLGTHPEVMAKLEDEVATILNGRSPTVEKLPLLPYTRRVFDEAQRLCPIGVGSIPRVALEDDEIQRYFIPKGSIVTIAQYFLFRHPEFWEDPERFDPDRFLPERVEGRPKFAYFPFGAGQHACIGKNFALMEATTILAAIVGRFEIKLVSDRAIEVDPRFTLRPKHGVKITIRQR
jgi:cytochrome P450